MSDSPSFGLTALQQCIFFFIPCYSRHFKTWCHTFISLFNSSDSDTVFKFYLHIRNKTPLTYKIYPGIYYILSLFLQNTHLYGLKKYFERSEWRSCHCSYHIEIHVSCSCKSIFPCLSANLFISLVHIISESGLHLCIKVDFNSLSSIISKSPAMSSDNCTLNPDSSLKVAKDIDFYDSESDERLLPSE